ncbi:MAG: hypothetical protein HOG85_03105 [Flavobacteriales bacterium]|jgi:uncharacterized lipoprotein YajG|nr:hypothetical protein [Flavobacteriales bacterium]MBT7480999.1 hypothetical protein [Flavobacteriales bacterium]
MKFTSFLVAAMLVFSSCEKEDDTIVNDPVNNTPSFTWKIDGNSFSDNSPLVSINPSDVLTINASDNSVDIRLIIYDFSSKVNDSEVQFGILGINNAFVTQNDVVHPETDNGKLTFSEIGESKLSGTFNFTSHETTNWNIVTVTDGQFSNITY